MPTFARNQLQEIHYFKKIIAAVGIQPTGHFFPVRYRYKGLADHQATKWKVVRYGWDRWPEGKGAKYGILWERRLIERNKNV